MVVRAASGEVRAYPTVETIHKLNLVLAPFRSANPMLGPRAQTIADNAVRTFTGGACLVWKYSCFAVHERNRASPVQLRSLHCKSYTIEAGATSQYENHLHAILDLPLDSTELVARRAHAQLHRHARHRGGGDGEKVSKRASHARTRQLRGGDRLVETDFLCWGTKGKVRERGRRAQGRGDVHERFQSCLARHRRVQPFIS